MRKRIVEKHSVNLAVSAEALMTRNARKNIVERLIAYLDAFAKVSKKQKRISRYVDAANAFHGKQ